MSKKGAVAAAKALLESKKEEVKMEVKDQVVEVTEVKEENTLVDAEASGTVTEAAVVEAVEEELTEAAQEVVTEEAPAEEVNQEAVSEDQAPAEGTQEATEENLEEKKEEEPKKDIKVQLSESDKSMHIIDSLIKRNAGLKIVASESKTGWSYFTGKKRLCKLLKTKRGVTLEINVALPKQFKELQEMENISATVAFKKHLGTMKHLYRASDARMVPAIMKEAIAIFKAELEAAKVQEQKEEKQAVNQ